MENIGVPIEAVPESRVAITGIAYSLGRLRISTEEKVKTIVPQDAVAKEAEKVVAGLGVISTGVAGIGESVVTSGALAVVKLILSTGASPEEIRTIAVATETPTGTSESIAVQVVDTANRIIDALNKNGYSIGRLAPSVQLHIQDACASMGDALSSFAVNGLGGGKAIIVGTDDAKYKFRTGPDETGGFGSAAMLVEPADKARAGIFLSEKVGHYSSYRPDFLKPVFSDEKNDSGLEFVARYPIVFGDYSNYIYAFDSYMAMKSWADAVGIGINSLSILDSTLVVAHIPYAKMPEKELAYLVRHIARNDAELRSAIRNEIGGQDEYFLDGFSDIETELSFVSDFGKVYYGNVGIPMELLSRLMQREQKKKFKSFINDRLNENKNSYLDNIIEQMAEILEKYSPTGKLRGSMENAISQLQGIKQKRRIAFEDIAAALDTVMVEVKEFQKLDAAYNKMVRSSQTFKKIKAMLEVDNAVWLPARQGNLYSASLALGLGSVLSRCDRSKLEGIGRMLLMFYGSGSQSDVLGGTPINVGKLADQVGRSIELETAAQREITSAEYEAIRTDVTGIYKDGSLPVTHDPLSWSVRINGEALLKSLKPYLELYEKAKSGARLRSGDISIAATANKDKSR